MAAVATQPPKKILLLAGWSSAGKDTLGRRLVAGHGFTRFAFADAVKDKAAEIYRFDRGLADTEEGKRSLVPGSDHMNIRDALIRFGENEKVAHGKGIWSTRLAEAIAASEASRIVVTDWRFPEELVELQRLLGSAGSPLTSFSPAYDFYPLRVTRAGQRVSPVASITEYALSGFPMPTCSDATGGLKDVLEYLGLGPYLWI
jgi:hypothetical protein